MAEAPKKGIEYKRVGDFRRLYANNVQLLSSNWDLELVFGELDHAQGPNAISQHTAINIPWPQAKVLLYFLRVHVDAHEAEFGRIKVASGIIPEVTENRTAAQEQIPEQAWKRLRQNYQDFIEANPEAAPQKKKS